MPTKRRSGASWVDPTAVRRRNGTSWIATTFIRRRSGGAWVEAWPNYTPLSATAAPANAYGWSTGSTTTGTVQSEAVTATPSGGSGSFTYNWALVSGSSAVTAVSPSSATTSFRSTGVSTSRTAVFRCTVSDGITSATTNDVNVTLEYERQEP